MSISFNLTQNHTNIFTQTPVMVSDYNHFINLCRGGLLPYIELRYHSSKSNKFWRVEATRENGIVRRWGRIGTRGQASSFGRKSAPEMLGEKIRKGYVRQTTAGHIPAHIGEVRSNGELVELVSQDGTVVWADTPANALKVLASCY